MTDNNFLGPYPSTLDLPDIPSSSNPLDISSSSNPPDIPSSLNFSDISSLSDFQNIPSLSNFLSVPPSSNFNIPSNFRNIPSSWSFPDLPPSSNFPNNPLSSNFSNNPSSTFNFSAPYYNNQQFSSPSMNYNIFNNTDQLLYPPVNQISNNADLLLSPYCSICGDRTTGKHYGAPSCDGCKGFFRRSIRKKQIYSCRLSKNCAIDKDKRNRCRYCRLMKCYAAGMRKSAVQNERDKISSNKPIQENDSSSRLSITVLLGVEMTRSQRNIDVTTQPIAGVNEILESIKQQLLNLLEWVRQISEHSRLSIDDQDALLEARAGELLLLGLARRSFNLNDILLLGNNYILIKDRPIGHYVEETGPCKLSKRVIDELIKSLTDVRIDENELAYLRAIIFFNPNTKGLCNRDLVNNLRKEVQANLEHYIKSKPRNSRGRLGELLLILPVLQSISAEMITQIQLITAMESIEIDSLLERLFFKLW